MENNQEFDSFYFWAALYKRKWFIILFVLVVTLASVVLVFNMPIKYKSTVNLVPPKSSESMLETALGGMSTALKSFGLSKLGGSASEGYTFMVVLNSRSVIDSVIHKYELYNIYGIDRTKMSLVREEFLDNVKISYEEDGNYVIDVWDTDKERAAIIANDYVDIANQVAIDLASREAIDSRILLEKRLESVDSILKVVGYELQKFSGKTMIISPMEQATAVSKAYAELKAQMIQYDVLYDISKLTYGENAPTTQMQKLQKEQMQESIKRIENEPGFAGNFALKDATKIGIEYLELFTEFETYTQVKALLLPIIEKARIDESKAVKSVLVLDEAIPADKKDKPKRALIVAGSFFGAFVIAVMLVLIYASLTNFRKKLKDHNYIS